MALVRWEPVREIDSIQGEMNRLFDTFFGNGSASASAARTGRWIPAMDLKETEDALVVTADLPGLDRDNVAIEVKDRVLTISGTRGVGTFREDGGLPSCERAFGGFSRSLTLPGGIDAEQIAAEFDKGVLEIRIPKPEERKPHRVEFGARSISGTATER